MLSADGSGVGAKNRAPLPTRNTSGSVEIGITEAVDPTWQGHVFSAMRAHIINTVGMARHGKILRDMLIGDTRPPPDGVAVWGKRDEGWPTTLMVSLSQKGGNRHIASLSAPSQVPNESGKH